MKLITLQTKHTTYQMGVNDLGFLLHLYYGPKAEGDMSSFLLSYDRAFSGLPYEAGEEYRNFSPDTAPMEYPCYGNGDYRSTAFRIRDENGVFGADLRYEDHQISQGKYSIPGLPAVYADEKEAYTVTVRLRDSRTGVKVLLKYGVLPESDVITRSVVLRNEGGQKIFVNKIFSACLDFLSGDFDLIHFYGRHAMERNMERRPVIHGKQDFGSRRGASSHQHNPFAILADPETTEVYGSCYGMMFLYSGNFSFEVEKDQFNRTRMQMGLLDEMFDYPLEPGEEFRSPEAAMAFSAEGLTGLSHIYHKMIRQHVCRGKHKAGKRPVILNNWEATYFDFNGKKILDIARQGAETGIDMLVLDDGWFGKRDTDHSGLGDWHVNEKKLQGSLSDLVKQINDMGLKFGIWIEPEMANEDSDLYREHPDWVYSIPGRKPVLGRHQLVLDFSRKEVVDYIFDSITKVIDSANIEYIKMDMNRSICDVYTAVKGYQNYGKIMHEYVLGVYDFLERMLQRYPDMLIEGCCGGGGRFDAGMMYYTPQIWCSDNTDAIDRIRIQYGTSFGYPSSTVSAHVSAVPNHQTGRVTDLKTRGVVAMAGTFGYELDLGKVSDEEKEIMKQQIRDYKKYRELICEGDYYRLHDPARDTEMAAWAFVSENKEEVLLNIVSLDTHGNNPIQYVKVRGLKPDKEYQNCETGEKFSGSALMQVGYPVPVVMGEYKAWQILLN